MHWPGGTFLAAVGSTFGRDGTRPNIMVIITVSSDGAVVLLAGGLYVDCGTDDDTGTSPWRYQEKFGNLCRSQSKMAMR